MAKSHLLIALLVFVLGVLLVGAGYLIVSEKRSRVPTVSQVPFPVKRSGGNQHAQEPDKLTADCPIQLHDVTAQTGITFRHTDGSSGKYYIPETVTAGLVTFDFDGDGLIDVYFPNGAPLPDAKSGGAGRVRDPTYDGAKASPPPRHALYRNVGGWRFAEVTDSADVVCHRFGLGAAAADYDGDGFADLYVSNFGPKVLYRNNGDGTFTERAEQAGVADGEMLGAGVCFLDADRDGDLDLFVANYVQFAYEKNVALNRDGHVEYAGPRAYPTEKLTLYRNTGDGTFSDANIESGIGRHPGKGMGTVCADYDRDGDTDIFVLNDVFQNFCFQNDGTGRFEEVALWNGFKYNGEGVPLGSMGVDCADYDNDGWLDFYQTSYQRELPVLFRNLGTGFLDDVTSQTGAGEGTVNNVKWGCGFVDFDNDGYRDLFVAMGHLQDTIDAWDPTSSYAARNVLLRNTGKGKFINVSDQSGDGLLPKYSSRGAAFDDLDNDGDVDAVILNSREQPTVLRNQLAELDSKNHWLQIRLLGVHGNRGGLGAQVWVSAGDLKLVDEVHAGRGYQSHFGSRLHFGLGSRQCVDWVEVHWMPGGVERFSEIAVDRLVTLLEGTGSGPVTVDSSRGDLPARLGE